MQKIIKHIFILIFILGPDLNILASEPLKAPISKNNVTYFQVLSSQGPLEYVSGAKVTIRNSLGMIIARGKTNTRGSFIAPITFKKLKHLPLRIEASGGKIITQDGDLYTGPRFTGHLRGVVTTAPSGHHTITYLDLLSTIASRVASKSIPYDSAMQLSRQSLRIGKNAPTNILRWRNKYVGASELDDEISKHINYDLYVKNLSLRIRKGETITELTPPRNTSVENKTSTSITSIISHALIGSSENETLQQEKALKPQSTSSSFPQCNVPLGNGLSSVSSGRSHRVTA
jgi:hypothetical protein